MCILKARRQSQFALHETYLGAFLLSIDRTFRGSFSVSAQFTTGMWLFVNTWLERFNGAPNESMLQ
jgi:hypothetical protein